MKAFFPLLFKVVLSILGFLNVHINFRIHFESDFYSILFLGLQLTYICDCLMLWSLSLCCYSVIFPLCFILDIFYHCILRFPNFFFTVSSAVFPIQLISTCLFFFIPGIFIWFIFYIFHISLYFAHVFLNQLSIFKITILISLSALSVTVIPGSVSLA